MSHAAPPSPTTMHELGINAIRALAMDAVQRAESGHPGTPMGLAPLAYVLWTRHLRHNPADPNWYDRDRVVLSAGHASMLLYAVLYLTGYDLPLEEIENFRQWGSRAPGHPEYGHTPGVEATTGPLGQGIGNAVGMAIAEAHLAAEFNRDGHDIIDHRTYFIASDGDLMEGISHEAASLAGHLALGKLIGFYDDNHITIEGDTALANSTNAEQRFRAYGWHVQRVSHGNDIDAIDRAIREAQAVADRPSLIVLRTHIAYGSPNKQDTAEAHGAPLGAEEVTLSKENLGWPETEPFRLPDGVLSTWREFGGRGGDLQRDWERRFAEFDRAHPEPAGELQRRLARVLPDGWEDAFSSLSAGDGAMATRDASSKVLNALAERIPELMGGAADLAPSTKTLITTSSDFAAGAHGERNMRFGIREHAMGAVLNGMALHGGIIPFGATFLIFSDYMRPPMRLAAMMGQQVIYVFTHDSIGLGEDGPTHQPVEQLSGLRAVPGLVVMRPADFGETVEAWRVAIQRRDGPTALSLTRQKVPSIDRGRFAPADGVRRGAYVLSEAPDGAPEMVLMASGSEVQIVLGAQQRLAGEGIRVRVVSVPSMELFAEQPAEYRAAVLPPLVKHRIAVEAAHPMSWYRWVGDEGEVIGLERFGASAPYERIYQELGLTVEHVVRRARTMYDQRSA
jgi:transketolase